MTLFCLLQLPAYLKNKENKMKGNDKVIAKLNDLLSDELTAINQYFVHAEMCDNWGYDRLHEKIRQRSIAEMKHAEKLIERIIFLDGVPIVSNLNEMNIGGEVPAQLQNDWKAEDFAIGQYNEAIRIAGEQGDNGSRDLLASILKEEEEHIDWIEAQQDQIKQMGLANYLVEQID
jgi:bacterioferritin